MFNPKWTEKLDGLTGSNNSTLRSLLSRLPCGLGLAALLFASVCMAQETPGVVTPEDPIDRPVVQIDTTHGSFRVQLYPDRVPETVESFLRYVEDGFYVGSIFHQVLPGYAIMGGGYTEDLRLRLLRQPISNEAKNGLSNERGTIALARIAEWGSGAAQFFVNLENNHFLDYVADTESGWGYCAFGRVIVGMDVVDRIAAVQTGPKGHLPASVPVEIIKILNAYVVEEEEETESPGQTLQSQ